VTQLGFPYTFYHHPSLGSGEARSEECDPEVHPFASPGTSPGGTDQKICDFFFGEVHPFFFHLGDEYESNIVK